MDLQTGGNDGLNPLGGDRFFSGGQFERYSLIFTRNCKAAVKLSNIVGSTYYLVKHERRSVEETNNVEPTMLSNLTLA